MDLDKVTEIAAAVDAWLTSPAPYWSERASQEEDEVYRAIAAAWALTYSNADIATQRYMAFVMNDHTCAHLNAGDASVLLTRIVADQTGLDGWVRQEDIRLIHTLFFSYVALSPAEFSEQVHRMRTKYPDGVDYRVKYLNRIGYLEWAIFPDRYPGIDRLGTTEERIQ